VVVPGSGSPFAVARFNHASIRSRVWTMMGARPIDEDIHQAVVPAASERVARTSGAGAEAVSVSAVPKGVD